MSARKAAIKAAPRGFNRLGEDIAAKPRDGQGQAPPAVGSQTLSAPLVFSW